MEKLGLHHIKLSHLFCSPSPPPSSCLPLSSSKTANKLTIPSFLLVIQLHGIIFLQFVPFRDFQAHGSLAQDLLTKEVLAELPDQLLSFMTKHSIKPKLPRPLTVDSIVPIMPHSANQSAPFASHQSAPYPVNNSDALLYSANHNPTYPTNQRPPYPTSQIVSLVRIKNRPSPSNYCVMDFKQRSFGKPSRTI